MRVLDASMMLAWLIPRQDSAEAAVAVQARSELDGESFSVPQIWYTEIASGILRMERVGRIPQLASEAFLAELASAEILADAERPALRQNVVLALARAYKLTAYDATYLELAIRTGATLYTFDRQLSEAARAAGVEIFGDPA